MSARFEQFIYAWAPRGLEGASRFQVAAATPRIRQAFLGRSPLLELAIRLAYWDPAPSDPSSRMLSWQWTQLGLFVTVKERVSTAHWAAPGGFIVHGFHTVDRPSLAEVCSLLDTAFLDERANAASQADVLEAVPDRRRVPTPTGEGDSLLIPLAAGAMRTHVPQTALGVRASSAEIVDALLTMAHRLPIPDLTSRSFSTSESPSRSNGFVIVGVGPDGRRDTYPSVQILSEDSVDDSIASVVRLALVEPERTRNALAVAVQGEAFEPEIFAAVLRVLCGESRSLTLNEAVAISRRLDALGMALEFPDVRDALAELAVAHWPSLGSHILGARVGGDFDRQLMQSLARVVLRRGAPAGGPPTTGADWIDALAPWIVTLATGAEVMWRGAPTGLVARALDNTPRVGDARSSGLRAALFEVLASRSISPDQLQQMNPRDVAELLGRWWRAEQFDQFTGAVEAVGSLAVWEFAPMVAAERIIDRLDRWKLSVGMDRVPTVALVTMALAGTRPLGSETAVMIRSLESMIPAAHVEQLLLQIVNQRVLSSADEALVGELSDTVLRLVCAETSRRGLVKTSTQLSSNERDLVRVFASRSAECAILDRVSRVRQDGFRGLRQRRASEALDHVLWDSGAGERLDCAVRIAVDGLVERVRSGEELVELVERAAQIRGIARSAVWIEVLCACDAFMSRIVSGDRQRVRAMFLEAVQDASRRRHFGNFRAASNLIGGSLPSEIRDIVDAW